MLDEAQAMVRTAGLSNVELVADDLFASALPEAGFDLVHTRFQLAPLGRMAEQVAAHRRLLAPGGILVLEDPDTRGRARARGARRGRRARTRTPVSA